MIGRRGVLGLALLSVVGCKSRFAPNPPKRLTFPNPDVAYDAALRVVQERGYQVSQNNRESYHLQVVAKIDQPSSERTSYIELQAFNDGQLHLSAHGFHTRDGGETAHKKLRSELEQLAEALRVNGGATRLPAYGP